jgi:hypothetical protein
MKRLTLLLILLSSTAAAAGPCLFAFFRDNGQTGVYFALSEDGYHWAPLNADKAWLPPEHKDQLMRDPYIARGADGRFHMVWTWGWRTPPRLGYASSPDLVAWSAQREVALFAGVEGVRNVWAPEIVWDAKQKHWIVFWATTITGRFPATADAVGNGLNHRIYAATTRDFATFSEPRVFFDPGYPVIDSTIVEEVKGRWRMIFKDERRTPMRKRMLVATAPAPSGPWTAGTDFVTDEWTEGPSLLKIGAYWHMYFDHYSQPQFYGAVRTRDFKTWEDLTAKMSFPAGARHGSFLAVTRAEAERLKGGRRP